MHNDANSERRLEDAVVERLRGQGLIARRRTAPAMFGLVAILCLGVAALMIERPVSAQPQRIYIVALYGGPSYRAAPAGDRTRAVEYGAWAHEHSRGERGAGAVVGGNELAMPIARFGSPGPELLGYFTIKAADDRQALALARSVPHLRYGGSVVVQPVQS